MFNKKERTEIISRNFSNFAETINTMEHHSVEDNKGFVETVTKSDGAGIFAFIYVILAILFITLIAIFG